MDALVHYRALRKEGRFDEAVQSLRDAIPSLEANALSQAGKMLQKDLPVARPESKPLEVLVLGQCTTSYLLPLLSAWAWAEGLYVRVKDAEYDQVVQTLMGMSQAPDVIVLLPWNQRPLASDDRSASQRVEDEMAFLQQAWAQANRLKTKLVQVSYDWMGVGSLGYTLSTRRNGDAGLVQQVNAALRAALPSGACFVDLESISAWAGKSRFYDERNYHWLKQPFSPEGLSELARHMASGLRSLTSGRRKVLVLDLDNTLWGGVVGEVGPHGIAIGATAEGEAFAAFQRQLKRLRATGVLLAVCSKNNDADAREPFERNDQMVLKLDDFASFHASWDTKPERIRRIAEELNLGLDSFVFFDDNPAERAHVRAELPEVLTVDVPVEPALYVRALVESLAFETVDLTSADSERATQYTAEASRKGAQSLAATPEEYLGSLEMVATLEAIGEENIERVVDLITKTNQFNLTTRRHSNAAVRSMVAVQGNIGFAVRLKDRFGDYGLVSVVLCVAEEERTLRIDTWLMSCRAMGRTLEHLVMNQLVERARLAGYERLLGEYLPTAKNVPVKSLLTDFGFVAPTENKEKAYVLSLTSFDAVATQVKPESGIPSS